MNQLHRSSRNKMVGGVAAGLAEYLDVDATLVRVVWALAFFAGGTGLIAYLVLKRRMSFITGLCGDVIWGCC